MIGRRVGIGRSVVEVDSIVVLVGTTTRIGRLVGNVGVERSVAL